MRRLTCLTCLEKVSTVLRVMALNPSKFLEQHKLVNRVKIFSIVNQITWIKFSSSARLYQLQWPCSMVTIIFSWLRMRCRSLKTSAKLQLQVWQLTRLCASLLASFHILVWDPSCWAQWQKTYQATTTFWAARPSCSTRTRFITWSGFVFFVCLLPASCTQWTFSFHSRRSIGYWCRIEIGGIWDTSSRPKIMHFRSILPSRMNRCQNRKMVMVISTSSYNS